MAENFNIDYKRNNNELNMTFTGQLTINSIKKITESVKSQIADQAVINITVKDVDNIDLTFIQLLHSIKNSGKKKGFGVNLSMTLPEDLKSLIINAGFGNLLTQNN